MPGKLRWITCPLFGFVKGSRKVRETTGTDGTNLIKSLNYRLSNTGTCDFGEPFTNLSIGFHEPKLVFAKLQPIARKSKGTNIIRIIWPAFTNPHMVSRNPVLGLILEKSGHKSRGRTRAARANSNPAGRASWILAAARIVPRSGSSWTALAPRRVGG